MTKNTKSRPTSLNSKCHAKTKSQVRIKTCAKWPDQQVPSQVPYHRLTSPSQGNKSYIETKSSLKSPLKTNRAYVRFIKCNIMLNSNVYLILSNKPSILKSHFWTQHSTNVFVCFLFQINVNLTCRFVLKIWMLMFLCLSSFYLEILSCSMISPKIIFDSCNKLQLSFLSTTYRNFKRENMKKKNIWLTGDVLIVLSRMMRQKIIILQNYHCEFSEM